MNTEAETDVKPLDLALFEKVYALLNAAAGGEREAALAAAERMARSAGLTLEQAIVALSRSRAAAAFQTFAAAEAASWSGPDFDVPSADEVAEGERQEAAERWQAGLRKYGSAEPVRDTEYERRMIAACADVDRHDSQAMRAAVAAAIPLPATVSGAWTEHKMIQARLAIHDDFGISKDCGLGARLVLLEDIIVAQPSAVPADLEARLHFFRYMNQRRLDLGIEQRVRLQEALLEDFQRFVTAAATAPALQLSAAATASEKRAAILQYLAEGGTTAESNRQIARRFGVSPQTIANLRKRLTDRKESPRQETITVHRRGKTYTMRINNIGRKSRRRQR